MAFKSHSFPRVITLRKYSDIIDSFASWFHRHLLFTNYRCIRYSSEHNWQCSDSLGTYLLIMRSSGPNKLHRCGYLSMQCIQIRNSDIYLRTKMRDKKRIKNIQIQGVTFLPWHLSMASLKIWQWGEKKKLRTWAGKILNHDSR